MDAARENGNGNGARDQRDRQDHGTGNAGPLHRRLAGGVISGPRERAAIAQAERDAARAGYGGYGRAAPPTVRIRGEFTEEQAHWVIKFLCENRGAMWDCFPHLAPGGLYYLELRHFLWPRAGKVVYLHTRAEFMELLTSHDYDDLPVRFVTPLPAGHRR